jgi:hypothetical protein
MMERRWKGRQAKRTEMIREKTEGQAHEQDRDDLREDREADTPIGQR